jgi:hypothetical protein
MQSPAAIRVMHAPAEQNGAVLNTGKIKYLNTGKIKNAEV